MEPLFSTDPIRTRTRRDQRAPMILGHQWHEPWPPHDRDPNDPAVVATRLLATAGRMETRLRRIARGHGVEPRVLRFLLLFAERRAPLRVTDVAEHLGVSRPTAGRLVACAFEAGLVDRVDKLTDRRDVSVCLTEAGRESVTRCLDALRAEATKLLGTTPLRPPQASASNANGARAGLRIPMW